MKYVYLMIAIALGLFIVERIWPANQLPKVKNWWMRVALVNLIQLGLVILAGYSWDRWLQGFSLIDIRQHLGTIPSALVNYLVVTFIYYWWHRIRHESKLFWLLCHQLHHSPNRIEIFTSFFKHPVEITLNAILSSLIAYPLMGCNAAAASLTVLITAVAEYFYHWNIKTPVWLGYLFQRPESHRIHHMYRHHTQNFADLPIWDILFNTFDNPHRPIDRCGFDFEKEDRFEDILAFRDVHDPRVLSDRPLAFLPTCIGCSKRWACYQGQNPDTEDTDKQEAQK